MKNLARFLACFAIGLPFSASAWAADIVELKGDQPRVGGAVKSQSPTELVVMAGPGNKKEEKIPANEILSVQWDGEPANVRLARSAEDGGQLQAALDGYQKALTEAEADQTNLKTDLEFLIARVTAKQAKADPQQADAAIKLLEAYRTGHANTFRFYDSLLLLGEAHVIKGDYTQAEPIFKQLEKAPWNDYKMASQIAQGRLLLRQDNVTGAQTQFQAVAGQSAKTPAEKARQFEAKLGLATCLQRQNQFDQAAKALDEVIKLAPAEDAKTMAEAYLRKGDNLLAAGQKKDALLAYLHVDVLFASEKDLHAEALYHLANLWNEVAQPGRAADARAKLGADYPNSEWAKKLSGN